jgi:hypothetical protein
MTPEKVTTRTTVPLEKINPGIMTLPGKTLANLNLIMRVAVMIVRPGSYAVLPTRMAPSARSVTCVMVGHLGITLGYLVITLGHLGITFG